MEGSVLSFLKAEWKVSDIGSAQLNINILFQLLEIQQNYHKKALEEIEKKLPKMKDALGNSRYM